MTTQINFTNSTLNTNNLTVSGQTQFSKLPTCSVVPTIGEEFVNKGYVDSLVGQYSGGYNMFFNYSVTDGAYKQLGNTIVDVSQNQIDTTVTDPSGTRILVEQFVSSALNITTIPVGIWNVLLYGKISVATAVVCYSCDIHKLDGSTLSAVLATSNNSADINAETAPSVYTMNITLPTAVACSLTTKLVVRLFVKDQGVTFGSVPYTVSTYFQNTYYSFIQTSLNEGTNLLTSNNNWTGNNSFNGIEINNTNITVPWKICYGVVSGPATGSPGISANQEVSYGATFVSTPLVFLQVTKSTNGSPTPYTGIGHMCAGVEARTTTNFTFNVRNNSNSGAPVNSYFVSWLAIGTY